MKKLIAIVLILLTLTACGEKKPAFPKLSDGSYEIAVSLEGGSGRASIHSPAQLDVENGAYYLTVVWSSSNYDYMIVDGQRYDFITVEGGSTFRFPVVAPGAMAITADTLAMSTPHEIDYTLTLDADSIAAK